MTLSDWQWLTHTTIAGNEIWRIIMLFLVLLTAFTIGKLLGFFLNSAAAAQERKGSAVAASGFRAVAPVSSFVMFAAGLELVLGLQILALAQGIQNVFDTIASVLFVIAIAWLGYRLVDVVDYWLKSVARRRDSKMDGMLMPLVRKSLRITIVILALIQIATMLSDKPLTSLVAGLGIGSLAIALGAQDTLKNFFGSILILADKPFEIGERIVVGEFDGPVEEIGFRSTRIRTLDGHLVTIPNSEMANRAIKNIGKRPFIKKVLNISVTYDTTPEKMRRALEIIKEILHEHEGYNEEFPPKVYFDAFANCSLNILVIYWYHPPDYWQCMNFSQRVNLEILQRFNNEGIDFAFPTQTLYLAGDAKRPLSLGASALS